MSKLRHNAKRRFTRETREVKARRFGRMVGETLRRLHMPFLRLSALTPQTPLPLVMCGGGAIKVRAPIRYTLRAE